MPHLRFRGMKKEELVDMSQSLLDQLEVIVESPRDYFTLEYIPSTFVFDGKEGGNQYPFVHVEWFDRGSDVMDRTAKTITEHIKRYQYEDVGVYFINLKEEQYFENGEHF